MDGSSGTAAADEMIRELEALKDPNQLQELLKQQELEHTQHGRPLVADQVAETKRQLDQLIEPRSRGSFSV